MGQQKPKNHMKQLVIKPEKCIACRTCELVCSFAHYQQFNPKMANVTVIENEKATIAIPIVCLQCEEPSCMKVCPVHAISRKDDGTIFMNYDICIGCKKCMKACPLGNVSYHPALKKVFKCDLCDGDPKCAKYCPSAAIEFLEVDSICEHKKQLAEQYKDIIGKEAK